MFTTFVYITEKQNKQIKKTQKKYVAEFSSSWPNKRTNVRKRMSTFDGCCYTNRPYCLSIRFISSIRISVRCIRVMKIWNNEIYTSTLTQACIYMLELMKWKFANIFKMKMINRQRRAFSEAFFFWKFHFFHFNFITRFKGFSIDNDRKYPGTLCIKTSKFEGSGKMSICS